MMKYLILNHILWPFLTSPEIFTCEILLDFQGKAGEKNCSPDSVQIGVYGTDQVLHAE